MGCKSMLKIKKLFPEGKKKAFTLSYDDGVTQDRRLVEIFNRNNLKATFNLNSGLQGEHGSFIINNLEIKRLNKDEILDLYRGHEVALHGLTHLSLTKINKELLHKEIMEDRNNHENTFNYPVRGMAYPNGVYNRELIQELRSLGVLYSRTVNNHGKFMLPLEYLEWNPTTHHDDKNLMSIARKFVNDMSDELELFYLWGHSYEFDLNNNWNIIEDFCSYISNRNNIWYATNIEIINYLDALNKIVLSDDNKFIYNSSKLSRWIELNEKIIQEKSMER